ncbi:PGF-CTERM sorting domain-containing protein [Natronomonas gomsonensis]|uniref:PGF-CTERM sorting domain-containing protein n=1 Tax=Natronomonas gomsonensis TaxID=1046043 RepID=UPI0015BF1D91|nr:PGF-CTERM sorting domain-containing protein [Natronomonas gomsonensis]
MHSARQTAATVLATFVVVSMVAIGATAGAVAADGHTRDESPNFDEEMNFTVNLPFKTDHYPGDQNTENGSIEYFAAGADAFNDQGAEEGIWVDYVIVDADWIDYSACTTDNTKAFGIDRGNNNTGTNIDEDLVEHQIKTDFRDDGITIDMYDWSEFANDPPYLAPEDAVVAAQGAGSNSGPCLTVTNEPGWYQIQAFTNGSIATGCNEEGNPDCEPEDKEFVGVNVNSNYVYVCECDSRAEAEEQLGPPPGGSEPTPTPEPTATPESTPDPTEAPGDTPQPTDPPEDTPEPTDPPDDTPQPTDPPESTTAPTATQANNGGGGGGGNSGGGGNTGMTPTSGGGPGFGPAVAILALLASALLANRQR